MKSTDVANSSEKTKHCVKDNSSCIWPVEGFQAVPNRIVNTNCSLSEQRSVICKQDANSLVKVTGSKRRNNLKLSPLRCRMFISRNRLRDDADTFKIVLCPGQYDPHPTPKAWPRSVARSQSNDVLRRR